MLLTFSFHPFHKITGILGTACECDTYLFVDGNDLEKRLSYFSLDTESSAIFLSVT